MPRKGPLQTEYGFPPPKLVEPALPIELPAPPDHLSAEMQHWWRQVVADFDMSSHHLHVLLCACDAFDRMTEAREILREEGLTVVTANGTKVHPCVGVERDSRNALMRAIRELDLDEPMPAPQAYMRPPSLRSNRRR
jgi:P27 family predicted phage terminase small subunit